MRSGITACEWLTFFLKSLKKCGINNALDGSEDDISYQESDGSSENNHEDDFSGSDDDFLGFYDE
jgi:hypothetical protein